MFINQFLHLSMYALASIMVSYLNGVINKNDTNLQSSMNVFSMGLTVGSGIWACLWWG